jgi:hypothetical protein
LTLLEFWSAGSGIDFGKAYHVATHRKSVAADMDVASCPPYVSDMETWKLEQTVPIHVSSEMCQLVYHARRTFQPEPLLKTDLYLPAGFVLFEDDAFLIDDPAFLPFRYPIKAICYAPVSVMGSYEGGFLLDSATIDDATGINVSLYMDWRKDPTYDQGFYESLSRWPLHLFHHTTFQFGKTVAEQIGPLSDHLERFDEESDDIEAASALVAHDFEKIVQVLFRLLKQQVVLPVVSETPRPTRRRAMRANVDSRVHVVTLRRPRRAGNSDPEAEPKNWTHRWMVNGHWRNQWYPSIQQHRQIWINGYTKGPEDKPLVLKDRAYQLTR